MTPTVESRQLRDYLKTLLRRTALLHVGAGGVSFVASMAWVGVAMLLWAAVSGAPDEAVARFVSALVIATGIGLAALFIAWPLLRMPRLHTLAAEIEKRKDLRELLRAGYEFSTHPDAAGRYAPDLVREVIDRAAREVSGLEVRGLFLSRKNLAMVPVAYGGLVILFVATLWAPATVIESLRRVATPAAVARSTHRANIYAQPGNLTVLAGNDVTVSGLDLGRGSDPVSVHFTVGDDFWKTAEASPAGSGEHSAGESADLHFRKYSHTFRNLRHSLRYYFSSGEVRSPAYTIRVVHEPMLTRMQVALTPPAYTGEKGSVLTDDGGNVQALEGTHVRIDATSNNLLAGAWVRFGNGEPTPVSFAGREIAFEFDALDDGSYSILLEDTLGFKTAGPLEYSVEVFQDHAPSLDVITPGEDTMLPRSRRIGVSFLAGDDYGVLRAALYRRKAGEEKFERTPIPLGDQRNSRELAVAWEWALGEVSLFPGNAIEYFIQVSDNNVVTGPGVTRSRLYRVTVPTMADLFDRSREEDAHRDDMMEQAIKDSREFREKLKKITREFVKTEKMEWSQKKQIDRALEKQEDAEQQLEAVRQSLDQTLQELSENRMTTQKIGEKMEEIRELLEKIDNEELRKRMEELRKAVEKLKPEDIRKALKDLDIDTEKMLEKLERTAELLKQVQKEQQMEEVVRKTRDMMESQNELNRDTAESHADDKSEMKDLAERQKEMAERADELAEAMDELEKMTEQSDEQTAGQMQEMKKNMRGEQSAKENMERASEKLQQQQRQAAMSEQQQAMEKMIALFKQASQAQQQMQQNSQKKLAQNFQKFARQTLELSKRQESLADEIGRAQPSPGRKGESGSLAERQMSYLRSANKVSESIREVAGQSTAVSENLLARLEEARQRMESSVMFLEQNKGFMSKAHANNAIQSLNSAVIEMLRGAKQCSAGSPQGSGQNAAQQLMQQLIPQQQDVVKQTQQMLEMQAAGEKLRQQRQAELDRLAGQQRSVRDVAREIERSMQGNRELLGSLDRTVDEMEAISKSIEQGDISEDLLSREYRILSRLLDSQRSVHSRDYENKRESQTALDMFSSGHSAAERSRRVQTLREEIKRAMQLKAPGEFEDLIKLYFRALAEQTSGSIRSGRSN